jgi:CRP/FNR family cyclic AMP-dependent transcriptional regulator
VAAMPAEVSFLKQIPLLAMLDDDELAVLCTAVAAKSLTVGETLFKAKDQGDSMFIVQEGAVELFVRDTVGQKIVLRVAKAGDVFGELSLLDGGPRTASAVATEPSELVVLDREDLHNLFVKRPDAALHMLATVGGMTRQADALLRTRVAKNANEEIAEKLTLPERISDFIAWFSGSMYFFGLNAIWFLVWIVVNVANVGVGHFDPYPFGLLTMIVSLQAIFLSIFVLISQNRQAAKDRVRSDIEYEINVKAELEVAHLHEKTDEIHEMMLDRFARLEKALQKGGAGNGNGTASAAGSGSGTAAR